jgi:hypothetical protein
MFVLTDNVPFIGSENKGDDEATDNARFADLTMPA